jgi:hypothetical protein
MFAFQSAVRAERVPASVSPSSPTQEVRHTRVPGIRARAIFQSAGDALPVGIRRQMESAFGDDFGNVRINRKPEVQATLEAFDAQACTLGNRVVMAPRIGLDSVDGRRLLAHELTHVIQQRRGMTIAASSNGSLEDEAESSANLPANRALVRRSAAPGQAQFARHTVNHRVFEVGDVSVNSAAGDDIAHGEVLFPGPDRGHVVVTGDRHLGYEVAWTTPDDPFRWSRFKDIVDRAALDINAVSPTATFATTFAVRGTATGTPTTIPAAAPSSAPASAAGERPTAGAARAPTAVPRSAPAAAGPASTAGTVPGSAWVTSRVDISLLTNPGGIAGGITLPTLRRMQSIFPSARSFAASADNARDKIFYDRTAHGAGLLGGNSLAHELFGHLWLALNGLPFRHGHGDALTAAHGVRDPFGNVVAGPVSDFIDLLVGATTAPLGSPTQHVSPAFLSDSLAEVKRLSPLPGSLVRSGRKFTVSDALGLQWEYLSNNYEVLAQTSASSAASVVNDIVSLIHGLSPDQLYAFQGFLDQVTSLPSVLGPSPRRSRLAQDVIRALTVPTTSPSRP